ARQLAVWARNSAGALDISAGPVLPVGVAREACAAAEGARWAREALRRIRTEKTEFPEDVLQFSAVAEEAARLAEARLQDAEIRLKGQTPAARGCRDDAVGERLRAGRADRLAALSELAAARHPLAGLAARFAQLRDPEPAVRVAAQAY
ncbi:MAG: HEAT repeat domain-containing protein, partial [Deltaproteobacteria bacterium]|nr:HEAT repeat domain-containing protein [Deltaproteobacteria bacterium]